MTYEKAAVRGAGARPVAFFLRFQLKNPQSHINNSMNRSLRLSPSYSSSKRNKAPEGSFLGNLAR
jgi:hypothetical protein